MSQIKRCPQCQDASDFCVTTQYQLECGYCGFVIGNIKPLWKAITHPYCIATSNNILLAEGLTFAQARNRVNYYVEYEEDCYIGLMKDFIPS